MKTALMASLIFIMGAKCDTYYGREKKEIFKEENNWGLNESSRAGIEKNAEVYCNSASV